MGRNRWNGNTLAATALVVALVVALNVALGTPRAAAAQAQAHSEVLIGLHAEVSSRTLPLLGVGGGGSLDVLSRERYALRLSALATAPVAYVEDKICLASPGGACFDGTPKGAQLATFTGDAIIRAGPDAMSRAIVSLGGYVVNPSMHQFGGGWLIERHSGVVAGVGYERLFGGDTPKYAFAIRYLRYTWVYQANPWAGTIGVSRIFRFD